jgi:nitrogen regulatory protein P-II 1
MMYEVKSIIRPERVAAVVHALHEIPDVPGLTISVVRGIGRRTSSAATVPAEFGETEVDTVRDVAGTGRAGDGKVFVIRVEDAVKVGSGARGSGVL